jgi:hypothetical protein
MTIQTISNLIISYLNLQKISLYSNIAIVKTLDQHLDYTTLYFCYLGKDVEIHIYNPTFIRFIVKNNQGIICDGISSVRKEIDKLSYYR